MPIDKIEGSLRKTLGLDELLVGWDSEYGCLSSSQNLNKSAKAEKSNYSCCRPKSPKLNGCVGLR